LQEDLLSEGPERVAPVALDEGDGAVDVVDGVEVDGEGEGDGGEDERESHDPKRAEEVFDAEAHGLGAVEGDPGDDGEEDGRSAVEEALKRARGPDDEEDEAVAEGEFEEVATAGVRDCGGFQVQYSGFCGVHG